jgi:energy-coupling factor transporter ATP-binding protein EcfA2
MSSAHESRTPVEPYPGLRPFLDNEEILLFGRERQVREVIERLRQTQFVAVIGGSGSGKSSLILAGVVPELRSFGIPGAGDFWVPMICTPGTNPTAADQAQRQNTPITRLARKFALLLRTRGSADADAARLEEIAARLREELGFANLVELYTDELAAPPGPQPQDARFLFVIDQFEELFHPTTRHVEDARLLVERVIDHFFSPHPRCYVVLTMRSEHLNDCACFLELPDAINKASYLVRRLDDAEMHDAIVCPAERLLRLRQLADDDTARLPQELQFSTEVTARLLRDVKAISDDPDHLPLLQHVLARIWQAACTRVASRLDLPDRIEPADLAVAASALPAALAPPLADDLNVLRASLQRWAEAAYQRHDEARRAVLDVLLRKLAVKDPNTGMYSQQRVRVDDCLGLLGANATRSELKTLLGQGFLGEVDYLYWDDDDAQRITLKVSHESLIRGWPRLRQAIDHEAERFAAFVELLRKCEDWKRKQASEELLLEVGDLRRARDAAIETTLADGEERAAWFRRLEATPAQAHLAALNGGAEGPGAIDAFLQASTERQRQRQDSESRRRRNRQLLILVFVLLVPMLLYGVLVQGPVIGRTSLLFKAGSIANATPLRRGQPDVGSEAPALRNLVDAAALIDRGRRGDSRIQRANRYLLKWFPAMPFVGGAAEFVEQVGAGAEPVVNGSLRQLLESAVWHAPLPPSLPAKDKVTMATREPDMPCVVERAGGSVVLIGQLFTAFNTSNPMLSRSIFVPDASGTSAGREEVELFAAHVRRQAPFGCVSRQVLMKIPKFLAPEIAFDANLRFFMFVGTDSAKNPIEKTLTLNEILWERADDEGGRSVSSRERVVLNGARAADHLSHAADAPADGRPDVALLDTVRMNTGRAFVVDGQGWRIVDEVAQRIPEAADDPKLRPLVAPAVGSECLSLAALLRGQPGFRLEMLEDPDDDRYCFSVASGVPPNASPKTEQIVVAVYGKPTARALSASGAPAPIASLPRFGRVTPGEKVVWRVGKSGSDLAGWIAAWSPTSTGTLRHVAAPWSTCALWRLGSEILQAQDAQYRVAADDSNRKVCDWP